MAITKYAEQLISRCERRPSLKWEGWKDGNKFSLRLIDRNAFDRCLVEWPDGMVREIGWKDLNMGYKAVGIE